jgi:ribonuclease Z
VRVTLLGTGCPVAHPERFGPAQLLRHERTNLLIDCGSGVTQRLVAAGCPGKAIDALLLTHLHSDHLVDLYQLIVSSWHQGRDRPQRVFGPPGTRRHVDGLMALWKPELDLRIAHERRPSTAALEIEVTEIAPGQTLAFGPLSVTVVEVDHKPVKHAYGFVCAGGGRRVAFSGDTRSCPALIEAARGADILVHEVFIHREMPVVPGVRSAETVRNVMSYHTVSDEVGKVAREAGVGCLVLTHFVPPSFDRAALLAEVRRDFPGPVVIGEDLMTLDADAGAVEWRGAHLAFGTWPQAR